MTGEVKPQRLKQTNKYFFSYKQLNPFDHPYHIHKCLNSEPSTFLLVRSNTYIIFKKIDEDIQLHMIMIYTGALHGPGPRADINNGPGGDSNSTHIFAPAFL